MRALAVVAVLSTLAACQPASPAAPGASSTAQACAMAGEWRIYDDQGGETWTIAEDGAATVSNNMLMKGQATLTGNKLNWRFEHGDNHGFIDLTLDPGCQTGEGTRQYTQLSGGLNPGPATSVKVQRVPAS